MVDSAYVLNNVFCFLACRFGKTAVKHLKSAMLDFYTSDDFRAAKRQLLEDVKCMPADTKIPHVPERRDGEFRSARIVDDMFVIFTSIDDSLKLSALPKYVADGPDSMPLTRLYESDLAIIMKMFERMDDRIKQAETSLAAMLKEIQVLQARSTCVGPSELVVHDRCTQPEPSCLTWCIRCECSQLD